MTSRETSHELQVIEPALIYTIFIHKEMPGFTRLDPRLVLLQSVQESSDMAGLQPAGTTWEYQQPMQIDLVRLHRSTSPFQRLVNLRKFDDDHAGKHLRLTQCMIYTHLDSLIVQWMVSRFGQWHGSAQKSWQELGDEISQLVNEQELRKAGSRVFGASLFLWAIQKDAKKGMESDRFLPEIFHRAGVERSQLDIGSLWHARDTGLMEVSGIDQDAWFLCTKKNEWIEQEANRRFNQLGKQAPAEFIMLALAHHKYEFEKQQVNAVHDELRRQEASLDRRAKWLLETQRYYREKVNEDKTVQQEITKKILTSSANLEDYRRTTSQIQDLLQTLNINRHNYLIHAPGLLNVEGHERIAHAVDQEMAALEFLQDEKVSDQIFKARLGEMKGTYDQIKADITYAEHLIERHTASLDFARCMAPPDRSSEKHDGAESVFRAFLMAGVALACALLFPGFTSAWITQPFLTAEKLGLVFSAAFTAGIYLTQGKRIIKNLALGLTAGLVLALWLLPSQPVWHILLLAGISGVIVLRTWQSAMRDERRQRKARNRRRGISGRVEKLAYAAEEMPDLLEDLPPTQLYRLKAESSLLKKIERKNNLEAAKRNITVEELIQKGLDYSVTRIGDAIGVRYVVSPFQLARVVDRVCAVTHPVAVDYKNLKQVIGYRMESHAGGKMKLTRDPHYHGKYAGFRSVYKSVHIDIDLWGVGAQKDINLMGEVQVRTPIQNLYADWFHDVIYKGAEQEPGEESVREERSGLIASIHKAREPIGTSPWLIRFFDHWQPVLNRPLARFVIMLGELEMKLFKNLMEWKIKGE